MKRVMSSGLLRFNCPKCDEVLEVPLGVVDAFGSTSVQASEDHHRMVEFIAEAPLLHAHFWGHLVRCHQPDPHPYLSAAAAAACVGESTMSAERKLHGTVMGWSVIDTYPPIYYCGDCGQRVEDSDEAQECLGGNQP